MASSTKYQASLFIGLHRVKSFVITFKTGYKIDAQALGSLLHSELGTRTARTVHDPCSMQCNVNTCTSLVQRRRLSGASGFLANGSASPIVNPMLTPTQLAKAARLGRPRAEVTNPRRLIAHTALYLVNLSSRHRTHLPYTPLCKHPDRRPETPGAVGRSR